MIPKKIHYCWFGHGKKSKHARKCIESWKKYCPDYEIIEWNEENYDFSSAPLFVKQAMETKKWAFATDYIRYQVVHEHGGIYFDTDVEVLKNLDDLLENKAFFGVQHNHIVASGLGFGAEQGLPLLLELMENYEGIPFLLPDGKMDDRGCPRRDAPVFQAHGMVMDGSEQILEDGIHVFPKEYFCPRGFNDGTLRITENTYTIHWFDASWLPAIERWKYGSKRTIRRVLGPERVHRIKNMLIRKKQEKS